MSRKSRSRSWRELRFGLWFGLIVALILINVLQMTGTQVGRLVTPGDAQASAAASLRVIDGDTFEYRGERIRIADIDTPELNGACASEVALAQRAKARLRVLLTSAPFELRRVGRDEDSYGRKLRVVTRDGRSLGDMMVGEGLARTWTGRREPWC